MLAISRRCVTVKLLWTIIVKAQDSKQKVARLIHKKKEPGVWGFLSE